MNNQFKPGQKVRCIDANGQDRIKVGHVYTVRDYRVALMSIEEFTGLFHRCRFEATNDEPDLASFDWYIPVTDQIEHDLVVNWLKSRGWSAMLSDEYDLSLIHI